MDVSILSVLARPGTLSFPSNLSLAKEFSSVGGRIVRRPTGHLIFYGPFDRRILATDPDGNPLHECEWMVAPDGGLRFSRARFRLDWGQWVGLKPSGLINETVLDLSRKPGWERLQADDLRHMAAHAMQVPLDEVRFFYSDEDLRIDGRGQATIRHRKDAFYVLEDGTFEVAPPRVRFMACMGAMHWDHIDFLPVVELFQSLLPGTGSAAFELIRGLYDDQNENRPEPRPLRYRGIPTYPSEAAFRLFSGFFTPRAPEGEQAFELFLNPSRSHEVTWRPAPDPPVRYVDATAGLCVTVKDGIVQKATLVDDRSGLPFLRSEPARTAPYQRTVAVMHGRLVLVDGPNRLERTLPQGWGPLQDSADDPGASHHTKAVRPGWRAFLDADFPAVTPREAFSAVLLYEENDREIAELSTQPFTADYVRDLLEDVPALASRLTRMDDVLIDGMDAVATTCIDLSRSRHHTVLYRHPAYAQKQAQTLWSLLEKRGLLSWMPAFTFLPSGLHRGRIYQGRYDLIYTWVAFADFSRTAQLGEMAEAVAKALRPQGLAYVVGPPSLGRTLQDRGLRVLRADAVEDLTTFRMHQTVLPRARLRAGATLFHLTTP